MSGDLTDHQTGKARLPGWWDPDTRRWYEDEYQVSSYTSNMAWVIIALAKYYKFKEEEDYKSAAVFLGDWIYSNTYDTRGAGGYTGGYRGWEPNPTKIQWKSTEHNIDVYVAFMRLYKLTGDSKWRNRAEHAKKFVEAMWNSDEGHFWTGTTNDGVTINKSNIPLDIQAWALMAFGDVDVEKYGRAINWAEENNQLVHHGFKGFDFNSDKDGVWFEGTAQMAIAFQIKKETSKADEFLAEIERAQTEGTNNNGKGIIAACHDGVSTGFEWQYFSRLHTGVTAWFIFAKQGYNPLKFLRGDVNNDDKVDIFDLVIVGKAFGSQPGDSNWNPDADLNNDGAINIFDLAIVGKNFGKSM